MANAREIQSRMKSIQDTMKITNAMYMISSTKLRKAKKLSLIHISEPTRRTPISYAVFCLKKKTSA